MRLFCRARTLLRESFSACDEHQNPHLFTTQKNTRRAYITTQITDTCCHRTHAHTAQHIHSTHTQLNTHTHTHTSTPPKKMLRSLGRLARQRPLHWLQAAAAPAAEPGCSSCSNISSSSSCCCCSSSGGGGVCSSTRALSSSGGDGGGGDAELERKKAVNKLLYRARQRGFLELDLLMGLWAEQEVPRMDAATLRQFAEVLDQENPDLFKWLTGQQPAPQELAANAAFRALASHVARQLADHAPQAAQAAAGKEWVRGWDDAWKQQQQQPAAAGGAGAAAAVGGGGGGGGSA